MALAGTVGYVDQGRSSNGIGDPVNLKGALITSALAAAAIANYCDHAEHNESVDREWVLESARTYCRLAVDLSGNDLPSIVDSYSERLAIVEAQRSGEGNPPFNGAAAAKASRTWRELQLVQMQHDRHYHPDVYGLSRAEQLRHYALHAAKLTGSLARLIGDEADIKTEWAQRRLPDMLLFGLKLHTVMGEALPERPLGDSL